MGALLYVTITTTSAGFTPAAYDEQAGVRHEFAQ